MSASQNIFENLVTFKARFAPDSSMAIQLFKNVEAGLQTAFPDGKYSQWDAYIAMECEAEKLLTVPFMSVG